MSCSLPLVDVNSRGYFSGCGLFCSERRVLDPWLTPAEAISVQWVVFIALLSCLAANLVFTICLITEHRLKKETFAKTPLIYDTSFFLNGSFYLMLVPSLVMHLLVVVSGTNESRTSVLSQFVCDIDRHAAIRSLPARGGSQPTMTLFAICAYSGFLCAIISSTEFAVNLAYRFYAILGGVSIQKKYIHSCNIAIVIIADIILLALDGFSLNSSVGIPFVDMTSLPLTIVFVVFPLAVFMLSVVPSLKYAVGSIDTQIGRMTQARMSALEFIDLRVRVLFFGRVATSTALLAMAVALGATLYFNTSDYFDSILESYTGCLEQEADHRGIDGAKEFGKMSIEVFAKCVRIWRNDDVKAIGRVMPLVWCVLLSIPLLLCATIVAVTRLQFHERQRYRWHYLSSFALSFCMIPCNSCIDKYCFARLELADEPSESFSTEPRPGPALSHKSPNSTPKVSRSQTMRKLLSVQLEELAKKGRGAAATTATPVTAPSSAKQKADDSESSDSEADTLMTAGLSLEEMGTTVADERPHLDGQKSFDFRSDSDAMYEETPSKVKFAHGTKTHSVEDSLPSVGGAAAAEAGDRRSKRLEHIRQVSDKVMDLIKEMDADELENKSEDSGGEGVIGKKLTHAESSGLTFDDAGVDSDTVVIHTTLLAQSSGGTSVGSERLEHQMTDSEIGDSVVSRLDSGYRSDEAYARFVDEELRDGTVALDSGSKKAVVRRRKGGHKKMQRSQTEIIVRKMSTIDAIPEASEVDIDTDVEDVEASGMQRPLTDKASHYHADAGELKRVDSDKLEVRRASDGDIVAVVAMVGDWKDSAAAKESLSVQSRAETFMYSSKGEPRLSYPRQQKEIYKERGLQADINFSPEKRELTKLRMTRRVERYWKRSKWKMRQTTSFGGGLKISLNLDWGDEGYESDDEYPPPTPQDFDWRREMLMQTPREVRGVVKRALYCDDDDSKCVGMGSDGSVVYSLSKKRMSESTLKKRLSASHKSHGDTPRPSHSRGRPSRLAFWRDRSQHERQMTLSINTTDQSMTVRETPDLEKLPSFEFGCALVPTSIRATGLVS